MHYPKTEQRKLTLTYLYEWKPNQDTNGEETDRHA